MIQGLFNHAVRARAARVVASTAIVDRLQPDLLSCVVFLVVIFHY